MKLLSFMMLLVTAITAGGCSASKQGTAATDTDNQPAVSRKQMASGEAVGRLPMAIIYKTNGDYSDNVPVTLNASRTALLSFPAPSDLTNASPLPLEGGFLLDRRGISANTAFTKWSYAEYAALPSTPSQQEIMDNIIPTARVTEIVRMPFEASEPDVVSRCNEAISSGLKDCVKVYSALTLAI